MKESITDQVNYCFAEVHVRKEDVTCVHAALKGADPETLLFVLLETRLGWKLDPRALTGAAKRHLLKKTSAMLGLMYDLEPDPMSEPDQVIILVQSFEYPGTGPVLTRRISAAILDVAAAGAADGRVVDYARSIAACQADEAAGAHARVQEALFSVDALIGSAWTDVLGRAVWLPAALTEYERMAALAHVFWVMGFSGFAEAVHEMRTVNLRREGVPDEGVTPAALCFQEQERKMGGISAVLNHNSAAEAGKAAAGLKQALVA